MQVEQAPEEHKSLVDSVKAPRIALAPVLRWMRSDSGIRVLTAVALITTWEVLGLFMNKITFSSASRTVEALLDLVASGRLVEAWRSDAAILVMGLSISALSGIALGLLFGRFRFVDQLLIPAFNGVFMTQKVALIPIIALWLGFRTTSKVIVVFLFSFFDLFFTVRAGVQAVNASYVEVGRVFHLSERQMMRKVILPATLPYIVTGLRLGLLHGMVGIVLAGFMLENTGLGGLISDEAARFRLPTVLATLLTVMAFGVLINVTLRMAEARFAPWQSEQER